MDSVKVEPANLRSADIIVSTTNAAISGAIRIGSGADYSHAMLYCGDNKVVEAIDAGVVQRALADATAEATLAVVLRRRKLSRTQAATVVASARGFIGRPYDLKSVAFDAGALHKRSFLISPGLHFSARMRSAVFSRDADEDNSFFVRNGSHGPSRWPGWRCSI